MAADTLIKIAVTPPRIFDDEAAAITSLLDSGRFDFVHLRHPDASAREMLTLIGALHPRLHPRLKLHGHFDLVSEFNLGGLHLNSRCPAPPAGYAGPLSRSCHTVDEVLAASASMAYVTLSPVFDSISKQGYRAAFTDADLRRLDAATVHVIALGGVSPATLPRLAPYNFAGYAMLGAAGWPAQPL